MGMSLREVLGSRSPVFTAAIVGDSMLPTYTDGDWVLVRRQHTAKVGDVVLVADPRQPARLLVKRVRGTEAGAVWVEGDNPQRSTDSRTFGPIGPDLILGRVLLRYYPLRLPRLT